MFELDSNYPHYTTVLPDSNVTVKYRPYKIKEDNILKYAAQSGDEQDYEDAIKQIIYNCSTVNIHEISNIDFEWLFLKIHAASNNNIVDIIFNVDNCENEKCEGTVPGYFDINEVEIVKSTQTVPFKQRGTTYIIPVTGKIGMQLKKVTNAENDDYMSLYNSLISIYNDDKVYPKSAVPYDKFVEFIDELPKYIALEIKKFFEFEESSIKCKAYGKCMTCKKYFEEDVVGLRNFFG